MWYSHLLLPKRRMFTKSLSFSLMISLSAEYNIIHDGLPMQLIKIMPM